jgi:hypothetical protein
VHLGLKTGPLCPISVVNSALASARVKTEIFLTYRPSLLTKTVVQARIDCTHAPFTAVYLRELQSSHSTVTTENRIRVDRKFLDHKDLGNHLLKLCPLILNHPVHSVH